MPRMGILTSGGDAPGMNSAVRAAVRSGLRRGYEIVGIRRGYAGLIEGDTVPLDSPAVSGIIDRGGTILLTARSAEFMTREGQKRALDTVASLRLDGLVVIGGNGSLKGARVLQSQGVPTVGVPASIDNDIYGTVMAIGVDTALNTVVESLARIRDTAFSHERAFIVEVMGRDSGYIALMGGLAGGAEVVLIPEVPMTLDEVAERVQERLRRGKRHSILVVAEGFAPDGEGPETFAGAGQAVCTHLERTLTLETRLTILGHVQRGGSPTAFDRILASRLGEAAVRFLSEGKSGVMAALSCRDIVAIPLAEADRESGNVDLEVYRLVGELSR